MSVHYHHNITVLKIEILKLVTDCE